MSRKRFRRFLILIIVNIFVVFGAYRLFALMYDYKVMTDENEEVLRLLEEEYKKEAELNETMSKLDDPEYLKSYAKENYLYTENGNIVIKIPQDEEELDEEELDEEEVYKEDE